VGRTERVRRIELPSSAWEAGVLPLNYTREPLHQQGSVPRHYRESIRHGCSFFVQQETN